MSNTPETGSILVRRGPTADRAGFTPLNGEVIYDTTNQQLYIGDAQTAGGKPAFGDKIKVDTDGNLTELIMKGAQTRPGASAGLFRYNPNTQSLEYSDGADYYLVAASPFDSSTSVLYVSPNGRDDNVFGVKRGRTPGTAFLSVNAACREAERIIIRASKGLGPYQKLITYEVAGTQTRSVISSIADVGTLKDLRVSKGTSRLDAESELRSGFRIIGQTSGAVGIIEEYNILGGNTDQIVVKVELGTFETGEELKYGNPVPGVPYSRFLQNNVEYPEITIRIESGEYYEHYPIKVPNNTSIKGDEFRRCIIRPRPGPSASPYAEIAFKREARHLGLDSATVGQRPFGSHYLTDPTQKIYIFQDNPGGYNSAHDILSSPVNKENLKQAVIDFITLQYSSLGYDLEKCKRDVGYIVDAVALDFKHGGYKETLYAGLTYQEQLPTTQVAETAAAVDELASQVSLLLLTSQERAIAEDLIQGIAEIIRGNFNAPKNNDQLDVFLMNDASLIRNISCQGHGGFMEVLDSEGQILTKSPYTQTVSSFSRSKAPQVSFAGGIFIDGFCGNLDASIVSVIASDKIVIGNIYREPQTPTSFYVNGSRFRINKVDTVGVSAGQYRAFLSVTTPWTLPYYQQVNSGAASLPSLPYAIEILTAGNISMAANDFTQINDLGYGLYTTNNARLEAVSVFCYYCHVGYLAENGSDIRSLNGSTAYGDYALVARGSDPFEVSDEVFLAEDLVQIGTVKTTTDTPNARGETVIYVTDVAYEPFNVSTIEIDHGGANDIFGLPVYINRYEVINVSRIDGTNPQIYSLNIGRGSPDNPGIQVTIADGTKAVIQSNQVIKFTEILEVNPTRPSTALVYDDDPNTVYRVLAYDVSGLSANTARITLRESYDYVNLIVDQTAGTVAASGGLGDTRIRLAVDLDTNEKTRILQAISSSDYYIFGFNGTIHEVTAYRDRATTGQLWAEIDISPALTKSLAGYPNKPTLRAGLPAGAAARITVGISTLRCTGHDLLDIGTGSYQTSNYPSEIFGSPEIPANQSREVVEEDKGRVFFVTTDQDGNFRVGDFFKVDQGTGTVTFSASVAISNLDGIGFKRGVAISEFSTDDAMTDNASDTVPTESAVRGYVDRRLGIAQTGLVLQARLGSGFLDLTGIQPMQAAIDMADFKIQRVGIPTLDTDATNKKYTDDFANSKTFEVNSKSANVDNSITLVTDDINEDLDPTNLYFTNARARASISAANVSSQSQTYYGSLAYDATTGVVSLTGASRAEIRATLSATNLVTPNLTRYGNLSYSSSSGEFNYIGVSVQEIRGAFDVTGSVNYDPVTGQISFVEKTDQNIRDLFSAAGDLEYSAATGVFTATKYTNSQARAAISISNTATPGVTYYGALAYSNATGIINLTGVSRSDIRSSIGVGGDLNYNSDTGIISFSQRTDSAIRGLFSASGNIGYNSSDGTFTLNAASENTGGALVVRDANGDFSSRHVNATYFVSTDDVSTGSITHVMAKFGDNYYRSATANKLAAFLSGQAINVVGNSSTATQVIATVTGTDNIELVRGNMGDNDQARILVGATASNAGYLEIATADDGTEPIHVSQYTGVFTTLARTATLLDASGNTSFPGSVTATRFISNVAAGTAPLAVTSTTKVDNFNADLLDGLDVHTGRNDEADKIVRTDASGYLQAGWINTTSGDNGTTAIDRVYASSDGFIRYYTPTNFRTVVGLGNVTNESKATMFASPTFTGTVAGVTATHVGLGNVTNESKATMFSDPTFTGTVAGVTATHVGLGNVTNESKATMFTSPTFITPVLGTPASGTLTNATGLPIVAGTTGTLSVARGGTGVTTSTGTGAVVLSTSPTLVTPLLGTPTSGNLANCAFPTLNQNTTGSAGAITNQANSATITASTASTANHIVLRDGNADDFRRYGFAEYFNMSHAVSGATNDTIFYSSSDNYIRKNNAAGFRASVGLGNVTNESKATMFTSPTFVTPALGTPASGTLTNCAFPTLNQNTTGSAATLTTGRTINGVSFNGSANITITAAATNVSTRLLGLGVGTAASATTGEIRATNNVTAFFSSDRRLKENIKDIANALQIVAAIGSKTFDWTNDYIADQGGEDGYFVQKSDFGVIAQDVQQVFPQAVRVRADGMLAVDYEKLSTLAFGAIIELAKRVAMLEAR